ncbi:DUF2975 domain-containing protein [Lentilactobacillus sunkii]|uniref:DUF2975 domain-containing protein n=1 Tax=Lentilactobacillus sunkii DSM 19904 TaxID=1423808 RepID=A0A0R1LCL7_9LACO|nr:DUF2975 domain-containing protein [Lentilactobacillus sunkii]KRK89479.1 hypothetical protein FD17_GL001064 [Lentilactobacillus sunkii DSM 19904]
MKGKILFLKSIILLAVIVFVTLGVVMIFQLFQGGHVSDVPYQIWIMFVTIWLEIGFGCYVAILLNRLLNLIRQNTAFSTATLAVVERIKNQVLIMSVISLGIAPTIFAMGGQGWEWFALVITGCFVVIPFGIYAVISILAECLKNAIDIKTENNLTV